MQADVNEVSINGIQYVPKGTKTETAKDYNMKYQIVRTYSAGVFAGYVESKNGQEVVMRNVRKIWYWDGAASLAQLAMEGTKKPENCKFPCVVDKIELLEAIEILDCTEIAQKSIEGVKVWEK